jgi:MFS family permease
MAVCGTAKNMNIFISTSHQTWFLRLVLTLLAVGMAFSGVGAGICELTSLAVTAELAPTRKRGKYVSILVFTIIPFCPSVLWGQLIAYYANWRWLCLFAGLWALMGFIGVLIFYFPPVRPNSRGLTKKEIIGEIDFVGGFLSISGMILFLAGMQWGGYVSVFPVFMKLAVSMVVVATFA